jgi:hypothetical protein
VKEKIRLDTFYPEIWMHQFFFINIEYSLLSRFIYTSDRFLQI